MGNAVLNGIPFRIDPSSISWPFTVKTSSNKTIGGKVLQVFGTQLGDMTVAGTFGVGGTKEQREFLENGFYCKRLEPNQRKERKRKPAPPHAFSACRVYTTEGVFVQCGRVDCQDDTHRVRAALMGGEDA